MNLNGVWPLLILGIYQQWPGESNKLSRALQRVLSMLAVLCHLSKTHSQLCFCLKAMFGIIYSVKQGHG